MDDWHFLFKRPKENIRSIRDNGKVVQYGHALGVDYLQTLKPYLEFTFDKVVLKINQGGVGISSAVWDCGSLLAHCIEENVENLKTIITGGKCLELGSGTGLVGLMASVVGAERVVLTDRAENIDLLTRNIEERQAL